MIKFARITLCPQTKLIHKNDPLLPFKISNTYFAVGKYYNENLFYVAKLFNLPISIIF